jgi:hypothetical protein
MKRSQRNEHRRRLTALYARYNPEKLKTIDLILESFKGNEEAMFEAIEEKYANPEAIRQQLEQQGKGSSFHADPTDALADYTSTMERLLLGMFSYQSDHMDELTPEAAHMFVSFQGLAADFAELARTYTLQLKERERDVASRASEIRVEAPVKAPQSSVQRHVTSTAAPEGGGSPRDVDTSKAQVHNVMPLDGDVLSEGVIGALIKTRCKSGDVIVVHPGTYRENIVLDEIDIEIRAAYATDQGVTIYASDSSVPCLQVLGRARLTMSQVRLGSTSDRQAQSVPVLCTEGGCTVDLTDCMVLGGGGGIIASGIGTTVRMSGCTVQQSSFAGVYLKGRSTLTLRKCTFVACEVGLRVRDATFDISETDFKGCTSDGVTLHGSSRGSFTKSGMTDNKENGLMLSPSSSVQLSTCVIRGNQQYGIYVPSGGEYTIAGCSISANLMGSYNRAPPVQAEIDSILHRSNRLP